MEKGTKNKKTFNEYYTSEIRTRLLKHIYQQWNGPKGEMIKYAWPDSKFEEKGGLHGVIAEIEQETIIKAIASFDTYDPEKGEFITWIQTVARNSIIPEHYGKLVTGGDEDQKEKYVLEEIRRETSPDSRWIHGFGKWQKDNDEDDDFGKWQKDRDEEDSKKI